jgi:HSP20 family molecular chaperone IbpA
VFILADGLEVAGARLDHGLLHIDTARPGPARVVRRIPIQTMG